MPLWAKPFLRNCIKKGNQWHFGVKAHVGVDSRTKLIHSVAMTAANVHDGAVLGCAAAWC